MKIYNAPAQRGAEKLGEIVTANIAAGRKTLWLLSGGSNVPIACSIAAALPPAAAQFVKVALVDERYGKPGHRASNYQQLVEAGFEQSGLVIIPVLENDQDMATTAQDYAQQLAELGAEADCVIAQLGIGADAHIAGVKPQSPAINATGIVTGYDWDDYSRITLTLEALRRLDMAFVFAYGSNKSAALQQVIQPTLPLKEAPCQILTQIPDVYLYNDQLEGDE